MASGTIVGFDIIVILSFFFGLLLLSTAILSSRVHRQPPWYGFLAPLFIYDIVFMFGMGYQTENGPPPGFCAFQGVLLYSIPGWAVVAFGSFIIYFYLEVKNLIEGKDDDTEPYVPLRRTKLPLIFVPLLSFVGFLLLNGLTVSLSNQRPMAAQNQYHLYCVPKTHTGLYVGGAIMGVTMLIWIFVIVRLGVLFRTHYSKLKGKGEVIFGQVLSVYIRITAISIAGILVIGLYVSTYATRSADSITGSYFLGLPSVIIFLVFATQRDIIRCWAFWRHESNNISRNKIHANSIPFSTQTEATNSTNEEKSGSLRRMGYNWNVGTKTFTS
ncbi:hypothetical protein D9756_007182 [Leucocoprinus leucothites]|uniref:Uncharacterized protein n=1 Tax=Leucocoprinus leucothites TaxID=201217 RepID=A0A8H5D5L6_9AGAR|nr:hypothetical protein D9756_007182 [Leucoagaricus leucothites]